MGAQFPDVKFHFERKIRHASSNEMLAICVAHDHLEKHINSRTICSIYFPVLDIDADADEPMLQAALLLCRQRIHVLSKHWLTKNEDFQLPITRDFEYTHYSAYLAEAESVNGQPVDQGYTPYSKTKGIRTPIIKHNSNFSWVISEFDQCSPDEIFRALQKMPVDQRNFVLSLIAEYRFFLEEIPVGARHIGFFIGLLETIAFGEDKPYSRRISEELGCRLGELNDLLEVYVPTEDYFNPSTSFSKIIDKLYKARNAVFHGISPDFSQSKLIELKNWENALKFIEFYTRQLLVMIVFESRAYFDYKSSASSSPKSPTPPENGA